MPNLTPAGAAKANPHWPVPEHLKQLLFLACFAVCIEAVSGLALGRLKPTGPAFIAPQEPILTGAFWCAFLPMLTFFTPAVRPWLTSSALGLWACLTTFDVWYFRFFRDLPSLHLLPTWRQGARASESLVAVFQWGDLLLWLPVMAFCAGAVAVRGARRTREGSISIPVAFGLSLLGLLAASGLFSQLSEVREEQLQRRFQNHSFGTVFGLTIYHVNDSIEYIRTRFGFEGGARFDEDLVAETLTASKRSATLPTPMAGRYAGRNLIILQLESLEWFALNAEVDGRPVMPFLRRAGSVGSTFLLLDQTHLGRSADGQFLILQGLHPPAGRPLPFTFPHLRFVGLPRLFLEEGYSTHYFHPSWPSFWNAEMLAINYGFENRWFRDDLRSTDPTTEVRGWGLTDEALLQKVVERLEAVPRPFFSYVVTVMCHHPYRELEPDDVDFPVEVAGSMLNDYLRLCHLRDRSLLGFVEELARHDWGRDTVLVLVGDHDANLPKEELRRAGYPVHPHNETVPAIIVGVDEIVEELRSPGSPDLERIEPLRSAAGQIDIPPTLAHVFSLGMEETLFVGWNLFSTDERGPLVSRSGTLMDRTGWIQSLETSLPDGGFPEFEVSEMLLHNGDLDGLRRRFSSQE